MHSFSVMFLLIYALLSCSHTVKSLRSHFTRHDGPGGRNILWTE